MPSGLTAEQVEAFARDGVLFPLPALAGAEVARHRAAFERLRDRLGGSPKAAEMSQPQLHYRWAYDLATHPAVLDALESLLGPDLLVHSASIFAKRAHDPSFVSWHQDGYYWRLSEPLLVSAWVALADSHAANGCMRVLPGSQRAEVPHGEAFGEAHNMLASGLHVAAPVDESRAVEVTLAAGEMSLHHLNLIHASSPSHSPEERIGFAIRYTVPGVRQALPHHAVVLARGRDESGCFELLRRPPGDDLEEGLAAQQEFLAWQRRVRLPGRGGHG
ncbi:MAG TPA: phytanoyl-CoA dioxygenase family protein [Thermoanaerobaculia bacterium]